MKTPERRESFRIAPVAILTLSQPQEARGALPLFGLLVVRSMRTLSSRKEFVIASSQATEEPARHFSCHPSSPNQHKAALIKGCCFMIDHQLPGKGPVTTIPLSGSDS